MIIERKSTLMYGVRLVLFFFFFLTLIQHSSQILLASSYTMESRSKAGLRRANLCISHQFITDINARTLARILPNCRLPFVVIIIVLKLNPPAICGTQALTINLPSHISFSKCPWNFLKLQWPAIVYTKASVNPRRS